MASKYYLAEEYHQKFIAKQKEGIRPDGEGCIISWVSNDS